MSLLENPASVLADSEFAFEVYDFLLARVKKKKKQTAEVSLYFLVDERKTTRKYTGDLRLVGWGGQEEQLSTRRPWGPQSSAPSFRGVNKSLLIMPSKD